MVRKVVTIQRQASLDGRPIAMLVQKASQFTSRVHIEAGTKHINAKSIMGMMSLNVNNGDEIVVTAEGTDEEAAVAEIIAYLSER